MPSWGAWQVGVASRRQGLASVRVATAGSCAPRCGGVAGWRWGLARRVGVGWLLRGPVRGVGVTWRGLASHVGAACWDGDERRGRPAQSGNDLQRFRKEKTKQNKTKKKKEKKHILCTGSKPSSSARLPSWPWGDPRIKPPLDTISSTRRVVTHILSPLSPFFTPANASVPRLASPILTHGHEDALGRSTGHRYLIFLTRHGTQDPADSPRRLNTALKFSQPPTSTSSQHDVEDPTTANPPPRRRNTARKTCHRPRHPDTARKTPPTCHAASTRRSRPHHRQPTSTPPSHSTQDPHRTKGPPRPRAITAQIPPQRDAPPNTTCEPHHHRITTCEPCAPDHRLTATPQYGTQDHHRPHATPTWTQDYSTATLSRRPNTVYNSY
ncbi:hypothetical protein EDB89DRAFT_1907172 [Lactarius sanguifluus]|nr:hypothetical protein EDB89DRAFT_1907172 [Lactarius sanguifluus]